MGPVEMDSDDDGLGTGWGEFIDRPVGARPVGARPVGARPVGARPVGARPVGARPVGARPVGARPVGARPVGARPVGARPYWASAWEGDVLDPVVWSADITELVYERSAVMRLGATVVFGIDELQVPVSTPATGFRASGAVGPAPGGTVSVVLRPGDWKLEASIFVPVRLLYGLAANPHLAYAIKVDLAEALALTADQAFLSGAALGGPQGIGDRVARTGPAGGGGQLLTRLRSMSSAVRAAHPVRSPGWILHPGALDDIAQFLTRNGLTQAAAEGRTVDTFPLLRYDGSDGGTLLGFPFVTSAPAAAANQTLAYLSADWQEAWIGLDPYGVTVAVPGASAAAGAPAGSGDVVITASMPLDFTLRRPAAFAWAVS